MRYGTRSQAATTDMGRNFNIVRISAVRRKMMSIRARCGMRKVKNKKDQRKLKKSWR